MIWKKNSLCPKVLTEAQKENMQIKKKEEQRIKIYNIKTQIKKAEVKIVLKKMIFSFIIINMLLNEVLYTYILIDSECLCFNIMIKKIVKWNKLKWFPVFLWQIIDVMGKSDIINEIMKTHINIDKYIKICYFYIKSDNLEYNLILDRL